MRSPDGRNGLKTVLNGLPAQQALRKPDPVIRAVISGSGGPSPLRAAPRWPRRASAGWHGVARAGRADHHFESRAGHIALSKPTRPNARARRRHPRGRPSPSPLAGRLRPPSPSLSPSLKRTAARSFRRHCGDRYFSSADARRLSPERRHSTMAKSLPPDAPARRARRAQGAVAVGRWGPAGPARGSMANPLARGLPSLHHGDGGAAPPLRARDHTRLCQITKAFHLPKWRVAPCDAPPIMCRRRRRRRPARVLLPLCAFRPFCASRRRVAIILSLCANQRQPRGPAVMPGRTRHAAAERNVAAPFAAVFCPLGVVPDLRHSASGSPCRPCRALGLDGWTRSAASPLLGVHGPCAARCAPCAVRGRPRPPCCPRRRPLPARSNEGQGTASRTGPACLPAIGCW